MDGKAGKAPGKSARSKVSGNTKFRKRKQEQSDDEEDQELQARDRRRRAMGPGVERIKSWKKDEKEGDGDSDTERAREDDQREKEEFERRLRERDDAATKKLAEPKMSRKQQEEARRRAEAQEHTEALNTLREVSRQEYLKKREQKKLDELNDALLDERFLFEGMKLTAKEERELRYKREVYELAKQRAKDIDNIVEYRMPEAYDNVDGRVQQDKRFAVALERYR
eukprot:TRINITY_DN2059_c0_g1_i1.p1 TRINITY_DN2059_c0_g1~~TRINITY_DN2059_c0_g1_i1.p1  ORF type:complete len:238 (+),score=74.70 TRINITY_DN2059_c0_g1_i1:41-715(+)